MIGVVGALLDHDEVLAQLDRDFAKVKPAPKRVPPAPACCDHAIIEREHQEGRSLVRCRTCGHSWAECS